MRLVYDQALVLQAPEQHRELPGREPHLPGQLGQGASGVLVEDGQQAGDARGGRHVGDTDPGPG